MKHFHIDGNYQRRTLHRKTGLAEAEAAMQTGCRGRRRMCVPGVSLCLTKHL